MKQYQPLWIMDINNYCVWRFTFEKPPMQYCLKLFSTTQNLIIHAWKIVLLECMCYVVSTFYWCFTRLLCSIHV